MKPAQASIAQNANPSDDLHCESLRDLISDNWKDRKKIQRIIEIKNTYCIFTICSLKIRAHTKIVIRGYAFAILELIPASHVCTLLEKNMIPVTPNIPAKIGYISSHQSEICVQNKRNKTKNIKNWPSERYKARGITGILLAGFTTR